MFDTVKRLRVTVMTLVYSQAESRRVTVITGIGGNCTGTPKPPGAARTTSLLQFAPCHFSLRNLIAI